MRERILIIARNIALRARLAHLFKMAGYGIELADSAEHADRIGLNGFSVAIVAQDELGSANDLIAKLETRSTTIFRLAAPGTEGEAGVLDPTDEAALLASVTEAMRPAPLADPPEPLFRFSGFWLDLAGRSLTDPAGKDVPLTRGEFNLLREFVQRPGRVRSREQLLQALAGRDAEPFDRSIDMLIMRLRRKIEPDPKRPTLVVTIPGSGYKFTAKVTTRVADATVETLPEASAVPSLAGGKYRVPTREADIAAGIEDGIGKPSIAVLPFTNMSGDPDQKYVADGMVEDILTALSRFRNLLVIARNTSFAYEGQAVDVKQVGRELGVRYVLEGSVRRAGDRLRVTVQLLETSDGHHLWADRFDRRLEDIFAIQDEITASIVGRLDPEILTAEYARVSRKAAPSLSAWESVVRAFHHSSQQSEEESGRALQYLESALQHDPDYAQALGMKAFILVFRAFQGWEDMVRVLDDVQPLIARAMAANNDELWPHLALGMVGYAIRDNTLSMAALTRAVELSPNSVNAHGLLGNAHSFGGRSKEALACIQQAMRLSPRDTYLSDFELYSVFAHFQGGDYGQGLKFARQGHRLRPGHPYPLLLGASCAGHLADLETGKVMLEHLRAIVPFVSGEWVEATSPYVLKEDRARLVDGLVRVGLRVNQPDVECHLMPASENSDSQAVSKSIEM